MGFNSGSKGLRGRTIDFSELHAVAELGIETCKRLGCLLKLGLFENVYIRVGYSAKSNNWWRGRGGDSDFMNYDASIVCPYSDWAERTGRPGNRSFPGKVKRFFCLSKRPHRQWGPPSSCSVGTGELLPRGKADRLSSQPFTSACCPG